MNAAGDLLCLGTGLTAAVRHIVQPVFYAAHLADQLPGGLILLQGRLVQLCRLAAQLLCHCGKPICGSAESKKGFVHGMGDCVQAAADQRKIPLILHLGTGTQITVRDTGQYLLDIGYVPVYALQRVVQGLCHNLQFI